MTPDRLNAPDCTDSAEHRRSVLEAKEWVARLALNSDDERRRFFAWLNASSLNHYAFRQVCSAEESLDNCLAKQLPSASKGRRHPGAIILPPGYTLNSLARFLLTNAAYSKRVRPLIADMQNDYIQAIAAGHEWHARWIRARVWLLLIPAWLYTLVGDKLTGLLRPGR